MKIYLVRHGETDANKNGIMQGQNQNLQLNETGIRQATNLKNKLVTVTLPDNVKSATVEVYFRTTKLQYCSLLLTIVTLLSTGGYVWILNKQIKE